LIRLGEEKANAQSTEQFRSQILTENEIEKDEDNPTTENEEGGLTSKEKKSLKYKVQKNLLDYFETHNETKKKNKKLEKKKERLRDSEYFDEFKNKFEDNPIEVKHRSTELEKHLKEKEEYEEDHFIRLKESKKKLNRLKRKDRKKDDLFNTNDLKYIPEFN